MSKAYDWNHKVKTLLLAIGQFEQLTGGFKSSLIRKTVVTRKQRTMVEVKHWRGKTSVLLQTFEGDKTSLHLYYRDDRPVMYHGTALAFYDVCPKKLFQKLERLVKRHYANYQCEILSEASELYRLLEK